MNKISLIYNTSGVNKMGKKENDNNNNNKTTAIITKTKGIWIELHYVFGQ